MSSPLTLIINAGGQSRRMGRSKALLPVPSVAHSGTRPLLAHLMHRLAPLPLERLVVVSNSKSVRDTVFRQRACAPIVCVVADAYTGAGALGGLATGLRECSAWGMVVACDMPLLDPGLLAWQWQQIARFAHDGEEKIDALVPVVGAQVQPFHAMYHRRCLPAIEARLAAGQRKVSHFLDDVRTRYIPESELCARDPQLHSFRNVNTPQEWLEILPDLER